jgi:hypothetical protein
MKRTGLAVAAGLMLFATAAVTQEETSSIIFAGYYRCSQGAESRADEIVRGVFGPVLQKHVDAGHLTGWVWLAHSQGGAWRRVLASVGTDLGVMMDAREAIVEEITTQHADAAAELGTVCGSHDDYIWTSIAASTPDPAAVGQATFSTYYACDNSREGRTNQIFEEVLAPLYEKHREMGHLSTWGFYAHRSGGIFRRLETFSGADHKTLMSMQQAIYEEANSTNALAMNEFREICNWHTDYMWNNATNP